VISSREQSTSGEIKTRLEKLVRELDARVLASGDSSRGFYLRSFKWVTGLKSGGYVSLRLQCLHLCVRYFYYCGDKETLMQSVSAFHDLAMTDGSDPASIRKAYSFLGVAYADIGDYCQSLVFHSRALKVAREQSDVRAEAIVRLNMGAAMMGAGLHADAMTAFQSAFNLGISTTPPLSCASPAAANMAQICFRDERFALGIEHIQRALEYDSYVPTHEHTLHRVIIESNFVQLAVGLGNATLADERLLLCQQFALKAGTKRASLIADRAHGLCEIDHGDAHKGVEILEGIVQLDGALNDDDIDCLLFLIRGLEVVGRIEEALNYVEALTSGLARASHAAVQALLTADAFSSPSLRAVQLENLSAKRSRLQVLVARRQADQARFELVERLAMTAELRSDATGLHGHRVGRLARLFAECLELRIDFVDSIEAAGRLHDIGKLAIPESVLHGGSVDSISQREVRNAHAKIGADLLAQSAIPELRCAEMVARHHHERWDGRGYPAGMSGKRIPVECRIVALADAFDAMTHGRPQVRPVNAKVALAEIELQKGKQFDPELAERFVAFVHELMSNHPDLAPFLEEGARRSGFHDAMRELGDLIAAVPHKPGNEAEAWRNAPLAPARPKPSTESPKPL
jgi:putative two-component system response regulator